MKARLIAIVTAFSILSTTIFGLYISGGRLSLPLLIGITVITLIAVSLTWLLARDPIGRIKGIAMTATKLAQVELTRKTKITPEDEISELEYALSHLFARFRNSLDEISREQNQRQAILDSIADGIIITDVNGNVSLINPAAEAILGLSPGRASGHSFIEATRDYELAEIFNQCLLQKKPQTKLLEVLPEKRLVQAVATPLEETGGVVLTLQDFTELKRLQALRREFITNISHDLRTPLASLKAIIETLEQGAINDPIAAKSFLHQAIREMERLNHLIQQLSELSRLESAQAPLKKSLVAIDQLLSQVASKFQLTIQRSGLKLEVKLPPSLPKVVADEERIEQAIFNLLHNAIKFTPPGGNITLSAKTTKDAVFIAVTDTGIGIPPEDLPHIFERFYKANRARGGEGSGLGLAIVKHIIEAHDGTIQVESAPGKGSTFTFALPLTPKKKS